MANDYATRIFDRRYSAHDILGRRHAAADLSPIAAHLGKSLGLAYASMCPCWSRAGTTAWRSPSPTTCKPSSPQVAGGDFIDEVPGERGGRVDDRSSEREVYGSV